MERFRRAKEHNIVFSAKKCVFATTSIRYCGRISDARGWHHDPKRVEGLLQLCKPKTVEDLQQYCCGRYPDLSRPFQELLDKIRTHCKSMRSKKINPNLLLSDFGWDSTHDVGHVTCVFPDASSYAWGSIITQIPCDDVEKPFAEQRHVPMAFFGKRFTAAAERWSIIEKEASAIHETMLRGDHLLQTGRKFLLFTDHKNLVDVFGNNADLKKQHTADKLKRRAMHLQSFDY